jgi:hypothetical protein
VVRRAGGGRGAQVDLGRATVVSQFPHKPVHFVYISNDMEYVDGFMRQLIFPERTYKHFL